MYFDNILLSKRRPITNLDHFKPIVFSNHINSTAFPAQYYKINWLHFCEDFLHGILHTYKYVIISHETLQTLFYCDYRLIFPIL